MSRKRKQKRDNTIMFTPKGYKVYGRRDGKGPPYRAAMEAALQQTGLMGVAFEAIILHAPQCPCTEWHPHAASKDFGPRSIAKNEALPPDRSFVFRS